MSGGTYEIGAGAVDRDRTRVGGIHCNGVATTRANDDQVGAILNGGDDVRSRDGQRAWIDSYLIVGQVAGPVTYRRIDIVASNQSRHRDTRAGITEGQGLTIDARVDTRAKDACQVDSLTKNLGGAPDRDGQVRLI